MRTMRAPGALPEGIERPLMWGLPSGVGLSQAYVGIQDGRHQVVLVFFLKHDGLWLLGCIHGLIHPPGSDQV